MKTKTKGDMGIRIENGLLHPEKIVPLFRLYTDSLVEECPEFSDYLQLQNYNQELENLNKKYGGERSHLLILLKDNLPVGCVGLIQMDRKNAELKRFFIMPDYRNKGLGSQLLDHILLIAAKDGYRSVWLDTLPGLDSAYHLYRNRGFIECQRYNNSPLASSIYLKLDLKNN